MDLTIDVEDYKLNIRAGGVIIHNNKLLVHKNKNKSHYCLPGGRVEIGESSRDTIKREINEELGRDIDVLDYACTVENFFEMNNSKYHEIYFIYKIEFKDEKDRKIEETLKNNEGKENLIYEWLDLSKLDEYNLVPKCLNKIIKEENINKHIIYKVSDNK